MRTERQQKIFDLLMKADLNNPNTEEHQAAEAELKTMGVLDKDGCYPLELPAEDEEVVKEFC